MITITQQHGNEHQPKYRVEISDPDGYGLGYGDTPRQAYAEAREDYQDYRESQTRNSLKRADAEFEQQTNISVTEPLPLFDFGEEDAYQEWKRQQTS